MRLETFKYIMNEFKKEGIDCYRIGTDIEMGKGNQKGRKSFIIGKDKYEEKNGNMVEANVFCELENDYTVSIYKWVRGNEKEYKTKSYLELDRITEIEAFYKDDDVKITGEIYL